MNELLYSITTENDVTLVTSILTEASQYKLEQGDSVWGDGWSEEEVQDAMSESLVYLISNGEQPVGTVSLQWTDIRNWGDDSTPAGYMHRLAVKDDFHSLGLGKVIVDWAEAQTALFGYSVLRLDCEAKNTKLCQFYEKIGFKLVGTREVPEYGDYVAALYERPVVK